MARHGGIRYALAAGLMLALPAAGMAQGTAPAQGVTRPTPPPRPTTPPPAPEPGAITDGRPRVDQGGGTTRTTPDTTKSLPLPPAGQADPPKTR